MKLHVEHAWDIPPKRAVEIQKQLSVEVITCDCFERINSVAGVDVGFEEQGRVMRAAIVVLAFPSLALIESKLVRKPTTMPYIPGLLSFRELPAVLEGLKNIRRFPDLFLCDGQGIAHPRGLGIASHLGLLTDTPSIGVGKSRLVGTHGSVAEKRGAYSPLIYKKERVGAVLRTRKGVKPVFVSVGHRISLKSAMDYVLACTPTYRLPETTRQAHKLASHK